MYEIDSRSWNPYFPTMLAKEIRVLLDKPTYDWLKAEAKREAKAAGGGAAEMGPVVRRMLAKRAREAGAYGEPFSGVLPPKKRKNS